MTSGVSVSRQGTLNTAHQKHGDLSNNIKAKNLKIDFEGTNEG